MNYKLILLAIKSAKRCADDIRSHAIGAVAIRQDGIIVKSRNLSSREKILDAHAEIRVLKKSGKGCVIYVARARNNSSIGLARPCGGCIQAMKYMKVEKCFYSISDNEYGVIKF